MLLVRERPALRHTIELETPTGRRYRWARDEPDAENVPGGVQHSSTMPGGYEQAQVVLPRKPGIDYQDLERLSTAQFRSASCEIVGEYRLEQAPQTSGDQMAVTPGLVGWQTHLDDDRSAIIPFVDRDLSRWRPMANSRRLSHLSGGYIPGDPATAIDQAAPVIVLKAAADSWDAPNLPVTEAWYDAGAGATVAAIYYSFTAAGDASPSDPSWELHVYTSVDDSGAILPAATTDLWSSVPVAGYLVDPTPPRYALLSFLENTTPAGAPGKDYEAHAVVAVYGNNGLTRRGPDPGGLFASDIVAYTVGRWAPMLRFTTGPQGTIRPSSHVIDHLAFYEPTTAGAMVKDASRFELQDWAVWEGPTFYWNDRGDRGRNWRARVGPAQLEETGPQADRVWESVIVAYRDVDGTTKTVGPPGSGSDTETTALKDTDPENPANQLGIKRRDLLQMGTASAANAARVGETFLLLSKQLDRSGRARLVGHVEDDRGILHPFSHVRAGDTVTFVDAADTSARRIVKASHSWDEHACSVDLDAPPDGLQALLEQLNVALVPLGVN